MNHVYVTLKKFFFNPGLCNFKSASTILLEIKQLKANHYNGHLVSDSYKDVYNVRYVQLINTIKN